MQYPEGDIESIETLLNIPITSPTQSQPVPLQNIASISRTTVPAEVNHTTLQPTIDLTMGVSGRDLGHVADDVARVLKKFGERVSRGVWSPVRGGSARSQAPGGRQDRADGRVLADAGHLLLLGRRADPGGAVDVLPDGGARQVVGRAADRDGNGAAGLAGVLPMLYFTGTALNVQSLLGIIFIVGIKVANTVLMTDFAQELRRHEGLTPTEAIRKAASIRVRPVTMTALAAFFAMIPAALALERGSEANAPLARAILGGLLAGEPATLFVLPCLYSLFVKAGPASSPMTWMNNSKAAPHAMA